MHKPEYFQGTLVEWLPDSGTGTVKSDDEAENAWIENRDFPPGTRTRPGLRLRFAINPETRRAQAVTLLAAVAPSAAPVRSRFHDDAEKSTPLLVPSAVATAGFWLFLLIAYPPAIWLPVLLFSGFVFFRLWWEHGAWEKGKTCRLQLGDITLLRLSALGGWPGVSLAWQLFALRPYRADFRAWFIRLILIDLAVMIGFAWLLRPPSTPWQTPANGASEEIRSPASQAIATEAASSVVSSLTLESLRPDTRADISRDGAPATKTGGATTTAVESRANPEPQRCPIVLADFPALHLAEAYAGKRSKRQDVAIYFTRGNRFAVTRETAPGVAARAAENATESTADKDDCLDPREIIERLR